MIKITQILKERLTINDIIKEIYFSKHLHNEKFAIILKHISNSRQN